MSDSLTITTRDQNRASSSLSSADDRIVLADWVPPREGTAPHMRIGRRWISLLWLTLVAFAADDRKGDHHAIANLQGALCSGADFHHFAQWQQCRYFEGAVVP
jgi:hypothetical protein